MNYVWGIELVTVVREINPTTNTAEDSNNKNNNNIERNAQDTDTIVICIKGNEILSKCPLYDQLVLHGNKIFTGDSLSHEKLQFTLGKFGKNGLLPRTGPTINFDTTWEQQGRKKYTNF